MYEKSVTYQYITNVATQRAAAGDNVETLTAGQSAIVDASGVVVTAADAATFPAGAPLRIAQVLSSGQVVYSPYFNSGEIFNYQTQAAAAATEHSVLFGSDGTDALGFGTITAGDTYTLSLILDYTQGGVNNTPFIKTIPYKAQAGDTDLNVARGLAQSAIAIVNRNLSNRMIEVGRIFTPGAAGDYTGLAQAATVQHGSTRVTFAGAHGLDVGSVVDLDGVAYVVTEVDGLDVILDIGYEGASDTIAAGDVDAVLAADVPDGAWAISFTGIAQPFDPVTDMYHKVMFSLTYSGFEGDVSISTTAADPGTGTPEQVAQQEIYSAMNDGKPFVQMYPPTNYRTETDFTATYQILTFEARHDAYEAVGTGQRPVSLYKIILAVDSTLADDIADLNTILSA